MFGHSGLALLLCFAAVFIPYSTIEYCRALYVEVVKFKRGREIGG